MVTPLGRVVPSPLSLSKSILRFGEPPFVSSTVDRCMEWADTSENVYVLKMCMFSTRVQRVNNTIPSNAL